VVLMRDRLRLTGVAAALTLASCSSPTPGGEVTPTASARSREVKIDRVNPCSLLPEDFARLAGLDSGPAPERHPEFQTPAYRFRSTARSGELMITPLPTIGIERFEPGKRTGEVRSRTIQGFRALEIPLSGGCTIVVDIAEGQVLHLTFKEAADLPLSQAVRCQMTGDLADTAMRTLLAR
jgi:hypothetical protein